MTQRIGILGTGQIGSAIARRLRGSGLEVTAYDPVAARVAALVDTGVEPAATPATTGEAADAVLVCVLDDGQLRSALSGGGGLLRRLAPGTLVVALTTVGVETATWFAGAVSEAGGTAAVGPFFGSVAEAEKGALWFALGCDDGAATVRAEALLDPLAAGVVTAGGIREATALKLAANVLVFPMVALIAEAIALARAEGVDPRSLLDLIRDGTGVRAPIYQVKGHQIIAGDYAPRASVALAAKDLDLILEAARSSGTVLPLTERAAEMFAMAHDAGLDGEDMAAVAKVLRADGPWLSGRREDA